jgi:hypothetical protein
MIRQLPQTPDIVANSVVSKTRYLSPEQRGNSSAVIVQVHGVRLSRLRQPAGLLFIRQMIHTCMSVERHG